MNSCDVLWYNIIVVEGISTTLTPRRYNEKEKDLSAFKAHTERER